MQVWLDFPCTERDTSGAPRIRQRFAQPTRLLIAHHLAEVSTVLAAVETAAHAGQWCVGYVAYEAAAAFDPVLQTHEAHAAGSLPLAWFAVFDEATDWPNQSASSTTPATYKTNVWQDQTSPATFAEHFAEIKAAIARGDTYQINYTTRLKSTFAGDALAYFQALHRGQPNGYSLFIDTPDWQICSVSPELFFDWDGYTLTTQPMKGTAARGNDATSDATQAARLRQSSKEQAENLMIVDLLRNDLGRIAQTGSVQVPQLFELQALPTVWQMTSTITAHTRPNTSLVDIFRALFPCGSVTGAPKVKAMELIRTLESSPRGAYCGALGVVRPHANGKGKGIQATFNVGIRTVVIRQGDAECGIGSGITWDADCTAEQREFRAKQRFLGRAAQPFALLETLKLENGTIWLLSEHLQRLQHSAAHFAYVFDLAQVETTLTDVIERHPQGAWRVRLLLEANGQSHAEAFALEPNPASIRVQLAHTAIESDHEFLRHKTTQREVYAPFQPTTPAYFDTLLWNERGELTEFTKGNLVLEINGKAYTPPVSSGLLPGCLRQQLLQQGKLQERVLYQDDLRRAEKVWFINSVRGWLAVQTSLEGA
ncbi:aminodeoxychorismate synthase component I [Parvibium lacunae]|uniref:Aminodeoxychorismate synthase component I n=1 Tax=Parvibium lacunae TaxID=1888893 RepID=A0A368L6S2_9BURK|nr:aminodeoxychorismate synthase component I [Parvibium lacunae]RCS59314.1 aminodeoxychorismate synthase component I [Parvibium lacunae]